MMAAVDIVKDPFLASVLGTNNATRDRCLSLIDHAESNTIPTGSTTPDHLLVALSNQQKLLVSHLAQLRGLNRNAVLKVRQTKTLTAEARSEVDTLHLQLQNLYYEQRHLHGEIYACEAYDHSHQSLPLVSVEAFLEMRPELKGKDEREMMVARIDHEHQEREKLEVERQGLLKKKQTLIAENKRRKDDLASLDLDLEKFIDVSNGIWDEEKKLSRAFAVEVYADMVAGCEANPDDF